MARPPHGTWFGAVVLAGARVPSLGWCGVAGTLFPEKLWPEFHWPNFRLETAE